jgi:hypothetical protein
MATPSSPQVSTTVNPKVLQMIRDAQNDNTIQQARPNGPEKRDGIKELIHPKPSSPDQPTP